MTDTVREAAFGSDRSGQPNLFCGVTYNEALKSDVEDFRSFSWLVFGPCLSFFSNS